MRVLPALLALFVVSFPVYAQPPAMNDPPTEARPRMTWQQRFAKANATGDGQLTLEQARSGYSIVARNFQDIDLDGKGYVTQEDIRSWHKARREARQQAKIMAEDPLRPRTAFQRIFPEPPRNNATMIGGLPRATQPSKPLPALPGMEAPADDPSDDPS